MKVAFGNRRSTTQGSEPIAVVFTVSRLIAVALIFSFLAFASIQEDSAEQAVQGRPASTKFSSPTKTNDVARPALLDPALRNLDAVVHHG